MLIYREGNPYGASGGIAPSRINLDNRQKWVVNLEPNYFTPRKWKCRQKPRQ